MVVLFGQYLWLRTNRLFVHTKWQLRKHYWSISIAGKEMSLPQHSVEIFQAAVNAVLPQTMIRNNVRVEGERLTVQNQSFPVHKNVYLVGFGKAVLGMAAAAEDLLGEHMLQGVISVPSGIQEVLRATGKIDMLLKPQTKMQVIEGAKHNLPDENALTAANRIQHLAEGLTAKDLLFVLISGGGSALLPAPIPPVTLQEKQSLTKQLAAKGATIHELNTVRKSLSLLKGGGLAKIANPAQVVSLIMSDVIGDSLDIIASGPTVPSSHRTEDCYKILSKYNLESSIPESVKEVLSRAKGSTTHGESQDFAHVCNFIIGSNAIALKQAKCQSESLGYSTSVLSTAVSGDVRNVAKLYSMLIQYACSTLADSNSVQQGNLKDAILQTIAMMDIPDFQLDNCLIALEESRGSGRPVCLLAGGETTVMLRGKGKGGRNQEMALLVALELHKAKLTRSQDPLSEHEVIFLSGGTDGQDGPTEAAGAIAYTELVDEAISEGLNVEDFLSNNDSFTFFSKFNNGSNLIVTGLTCTNVMDVQAILIRPKRR
ncbi:glycerate kinase [Callorhinchus milii]|uniref:glycerate kinase n=1 Tax=Callorhinchus milii TaxID=7868 RepID=UPI001C3F8C97|nr:glycerate kinase [Callorhinchus milii]